MKKMITDKEKEFLKEHRRKANWKKVLFVLSCIVVFCTVYALLLPAMTMTKTPVCGMEEHTHGESCYETVTTDTDADATDGTSEEETGTAEFSERETETGTQSSAADESGIAEVIQTEDATAEAERVLVCTKPAHSHDEIRCYSDKSEASEFVCGFGEHTHDGDCFNKDGALVCSVPEHTHSDSCRRDCVFPVNSVECAVGEKTTVTVEGNFDGDAVLIAEKFSGSTLEKLKKTLNPSNGLDFSYSLSLKKSENDIFPTGNVKITLNGIELGSDFSRLEIKAYSVGVDGANPQRLEKISADENSLSVETESVSGLYVTVTMPENDETIAERGDPIEVLKLKNSGYFDYWQKIIDAQKEEEKSNGLSDEADGARTAAKKSPPLITNATGNSSSLQIRNPGGEKSSDDGVVSVSKTIEGTDIENIFDITLRVRTKEEIKTYYKDPDAAIVIVMDISNTMTYAFGGTTRLNAAITAAETFIDKFAQESAGVSKIGYVAFNTNAKKIFDLQTCSTTAQATNLKNIMRSQTGQMINYADSHERFTNVEAGLKLGRDMLSTCTNKYKYIIFLSDGFPTTYVSNGYNGYDPYCSSGTPGRDGVFYDSVRGKYCLYGTSYSDKAAIRARQMVSSIKNQGYRIFSIGIDVGGQTVQSYVDQTAGMNFSVVDRTGSSYEIGSATSKEAYKNWLKNGIGSGYYYDSTDQTGLTNAYTAIFEEMKRYSEQEMASLWVTIDPMPTTIDPYKVIDFVGFYDKGGVLVGNLLAGQSENGGENTASYSTEKTVINWDLKKSGFTTSVSGSVTMYYYELTYRVRLENEKSGFTERESYDTNDPTYLEYQTIVNADGNKTYSDVKTIDFPIPAVEGYLTDFVFTKIGSDGALLPSAVFTLSHDTSVCSVCRGDNTPVSLPDMTASPDSSGRVTFKSVPSGHVYSLTETVVPDGYRANGDKYRVAVAYDEIKLTVIHSFGTTEELSSYGGDYTVVNVNSSTVLPETGGYALFIYLTGSILVVIPLFMLLIFGLKRRKYKRNG